MLAGQRRIRGVGLHRQYVRIGLRFIGLHRGGIGQQRGFGLVRLHIGKNLRHKGGGIARGRQRGGQSTSLFDRFCHQRYGLRRRLRHLGHLRHLRRCERIRQFWRSHRRSIVHRLPDLFGRLCLVHTRLHPAVLGGRCGVFAGQVCFVFVHRNFRVDRPTRHKSMVMIQKRTTTWVSFHPDFSKWWCSGAIFSKRRPSPNFFLVYLK